MSVSSTPSAAGRGSGTSRICDLGVIFFSGRFVCKNSWNVIDKRQKAQKDVITCPCLKNVRNILSRSLLVGCLRVYTAVE